jgi:Transglutaminase-like superfamily
VITLRRWRGLPARTKLGFVIGVVMHPASALVVRLAPMRWYGSLVKPHTGRSADANVGELAQGMVMAAKRGPVRVRCLAESVSVASVTRLLGYGSCVVIGVTGPASFKAHAWVEVDGEIIGGTPASTAGFRAFDLS